VKKLDLKKEFKSLYSASSQEPVMVEVPPMNYLGVDGKGAPDGPEAMAAMEALYGVAYTLKFMVKKGPWAVDYGVMPLEGLWWAKDMGAFVAGKKADWLWTYMIMQPKWVTGVMVKAAVGEVKQKKNPPALAKLKFESYAEGKAAQIMHVGPYSQEGPTIKRLHEFICAQGMGFKGVAQKHHEIYLNDPRRTAPEKLKTIIRQPAV
jgi:hypothetical protein